MKNGDVAWRRLPLQAYSATGSPPQYRHLIAALTRKHLFEHIMCTRIRSAFVVAVAAVAGTTAQAFVVPSVSSSANAMGNNRIGPLHMSDYDSSGSFDSQIEEIEFKIYPDGRIEETVRGVKGENCHEVTEAINSMLGKTTASKPTEEMYETEIEITNTVQQKAGTDDNASSGGWEGSSSW